MPVRSKLPKRLLKALGDVEGEIRNFVDEERDAIIEMSERWKAGDRYAVISDWHEHLDELADTLANCYGQAG